MSSRSAGSKAETRAMELEVGAGAVKGGSEVGVGDGR